MASPPDDDMASFDSKADELVPERKRRRLFRRGGFILLGIILGISLVAWFAREDIARDFLTDQLADLGLPATYSIEEISPERQVLTDIVIGNPANPDLTIERAEVSLVYGFGIPELGRITVVRPRLYGAYRDGKLSFGSLDKVLFADTDDEAAGLPSLDLDIVDGRGLIGSDYGPIGLKAEGQGRLDDGFTGIFAANAPELLVDGCRMERATIFGEISTDGSSGIGLDGPVRLKSLRCAESGIQLADASWDLDLAIAADFTATDLNGPLRTGLFAANGFSGTGLSGPLKLSYNSGSVDSTFDLSAVQLRSEQVAARQVAIDGSLRLRDGFQTGELRAEVEGDGIATGSALSNRLEDLAVAADGTLLRPLIEKLNDALRRELSGSSFAASLTARLSDKTTSLVIPQGELRSAAGASILSLSRFQYASNGTVAPKLSGNFRITGRNLPPLAGRMERRENDQSVFRLRMSEYVAGDSRLSIPELLVMQTGESFEFTGSVEASGKLPGGSARGLSVPLAGSWKPASGLALWRECMNVRFDTLTFANLELDSRGVTFCPAQGSAIVRQTGGGLKVAAGAASLSLGGTLAGTRIAIDSGPVGFAYPGVASARALEIALGPREEASRFTISNLTARLGEGIEGSFSGADIALFAVPLDLKESAGEWDYTAGVLSIGEARFDLIDRSKEARFEPLAARDASLTLENNVILANALLRHPQSDREVTSVAIRHNLSTGTGFADLAVDRLVFDEVLQPDQLSPLMLGVVANAEGVVTGTGRIDWNPDAVTSSGAFSSDSLDFAAAFGPVRGANGTVEFTDLLSLTTAPDQQVRVASMNPGIEVEDGVVGFTLTQGQFLGVSGGTWPFMGGTLTLRPVDLNLGAAERRRYVLAVEGLDAALFVENLELGNLAATGMFDGELPLVFDELGFGRIEGGMLRSRAPGGNVSYVGELSYKDLSPIANYAFDTLKSLDYTAMRLDMDGPLTGDIVTRIRFDGVTQGPGTKQNFITRQIADLPIQFNVNVTAPFYKLVTTLKSIYDPSTVRDPRELGLLSDDGTRFVPADPETPVAPPEPLPPPDPALLKPDELLIQTPDSEEMP